MKKLLVGAAVFAAIFSTAPRADAQQQKAVTLGFSGGLNIPNGKLGDSQGSGFHLHAHATLKPSSVPFALRGDLGYLTTPGKTITPIAGSTGTFSTKGVNWFTVNANAVYNFEGAKDATFVPYVIGGAGFYNGSQNVGTNLGVNAGGGVTFKLSSFDAFVEGRIHNVFADGGSLRMIPLTFGINIKP